MNTRHPGFYWIAPLAAALLLAACARTPHVSETLDGEDRRLMEMTPASTKRIGGRVPAAANNSDMQNRHGRI